MGHRRVLISTISPESGGVPAMVGFVAGCLKEEGYAPVLAHYEPYSVSPRMSVPTFKLFQRGIGTQQRTAMEACETHAVGAWLPELEFTHYLATRPWQRLMASCEHHVVVSGSALAATPFVQAGRPFLAWVASGWEDDRKDRVAAFAWPRRLLDKTVNGPVLRGLERRILRQGHILALSAATRRTLDARAGYAVTQAVLPMPVDTELFRPRTEAVVPWRVGFSGRLADPRKNVGLLLEAAACLAAAGRDITVDLIGADPSPALQARVVRCGLADRVRFIPYLPKAGLARHLSTLDVFVVPSHQEGLCIAALEAMACGCPVVATRCGGPEDFVADDVTGWLVGFTPSDMAAGIARCLGEPATRQRLGRQARQLVEQRYHRGAAAAQFWHHFRRAFGMASTRAA